MVHLLSHPGFGAHSTLPCPLAWELGLKVARPGHIWLRVVRGNVVAGKVEGRGGEVGPSKSAAKPGTK